MDDDSDRSSEATELENLTTQRKRHSDTDDAEDSGTVNEDEFDDDETDDQREVSELDTSPMEIDAYSRTCQSETLVSGMLYDRFFLNRIAFFFLSLHIIRLVCNFLCV